MTKKSKNDEPELAKTAPTTRRKPPGRWKPGESGNPAGRPHGSRHRATIVAQQMLAGEGETIVRKVIERALEGDVACLRLCLERIAPPLKERPISVVVPAIKSPEDAVSALSAVLDQLAHGQILPSEAVVVAGLIESWRRTLEKQQPERHGAFEELLFRVLEDERKAAQGDLPAP